MRINYTVLTVLTVNTLALIDSLGTTWTSPMFIKLTSPDRDKNPLGKQITKEAQVWLASLTSLGSILGTLPFLWVARRYGRKPCFLAIALTQLVAYLLFTYTKNLTAFYCGRFLNGFATGGCYLIIPKYISEISTSETRETLSITINISWALGSALPLVIGNFMSAFYFNFLILVIIAFFLTMFVFFLPETPYYLLSNNENQKAEKCLMYLRSSKRPDVLEEIKTIKNYLDSYSDTQVCSVSPKLVASKILLLSLVLAIFQQLAGMSAILSFLQAIFDLFDNSSKTNTVFIGIAIIASSISPFLVCNFIGTKYLILLSALGTSLSTCVLGTYLYFYVVDPEVGVVNWIALVSVISFVSFFYIGAPWTITSEFLSPEMRFRIVVITSFVYWTTQFIVVRYFNIFSEIVSSYVTFWLFSTCSFVYLWFACLFIPGMGSKNTKRKEPKLKIYRLKPSNENEDIEEDEEDDS